MQLKRLILSVWTAIALSVLAACGSKAINPGTNQVDLRVHVVLANNDSVGDDFNIGCRLTSAEMTSIISQLRNNAHVFGPNTRLQWNGMIRQVFHAQLLQLGRTSSIEGFIVAIANNSPFNPNDSAMNVYFTGNYTDTMGRQAAGLALDPQAARTLLVNTGIDIEPGLIIINDAGQMFGGGNQGEIVLRLTPEHEAEHYLARFNGRVFGSGAAARTYDGGEHVADLANLLIDGDLLPPGVGRSLRIPGNARPNGSDELGEISTRIFQGRWNLP